MKLQTQSKTLGFAYRIWTSLSGVYERKDYVTPDNHDLTVTALVSPIANNPIQIVNEPIVHIPSFKEEKLIQRQSIITKLHNESQ